MRLLKLGLVLAVLSGVATPILAVDHERFIDRTGKDDGIPRHPESDGRQGGENVGSAVLIPNLPFADDGATCDNLDEYDAVCPYTGSTSPDVVYKYVPTSEVNVTIDLCASDYDTKVFVYRWPELYEPVACNDDAGCGYSGWQSRLENLTLDAGEQYYIVIDGYGGDCGHYVLQVSEHQPCVVECPPGAMHEGEPPCVDGYYDVYNGGC